MRMLAQPEPAGHRDGVFGLWERDGRVLLVSNPRLVGGERRILWDLPGGTVRPGESLTEALVREWGEETGLEVRVGGLVFVVDGAKRRVSGGPCLYTWRAFCFRVEGEGEARPGKGIEAVEWVPRGEAAARLEGPYHAPLRRHLGGDGLAYDRVEWIDPLPEDAGPEARAAEGFRRLAVLAAAAAAGDVSVAANEAEAARAEGVEAPRIEEALLQVVPYAGFPRTIAAFTAVRERLGPHAPGGPAAPPCSTGPETFSAVYGETAPRVLEGLGGLHPDLAFWTQAFAYGKVLARPALSLAERELLAVSILTALARLDDPLLGHMRAALRLGASVEDVAAAVDCVPSSVPESHRDAARALLSRL